MNWYTRITHDLSVIPDFISHYENELLSSRSDVRVSGVVEKQIAALPGITEHRFNQLQEIEAVLNYLNIRLRKIRRTCGLALCPRCGTRRRRSGRPKPYSVDARGDLGARGRRVSAQAGPSVRIQNIGITAPMTADPNVA